MGDNVDISSKIDVLLMKMEKVEMKMEQVEQRLDSMEKKLDLRLTAVEAKCSMLERKSLKHDKINKYVHKEVEKLKSAVNVLEQQKLENNIIIRGATEVESETNVLSSVISMAGQILSKFNPNITPQDIAHARRLGSKQKDASRPILVQLSGTEAKLLIMKNLKDKNLDCSQFDFSGTPWGLENQKIYVSDHLTAHNSKIFYQARQLKKKKKVKYAWTKLGQVFVKEDDDSRALNITSADQLSSLMYTSDEESDTGDTELESKDTDSALDVIPGKKRTNKHLSPRNTRSKMNKIEQQKTKKTT